MSTDTHASVRQALFEGAILLPAPDLGTLAITGKDRQTWLNGIVTCDLATRRAGDGAYGLTVAKNGKMLGELFILLDADRILIGALRDRIEMIAQHFDKYVIMEDVTIEDVTSDVQWIRAHGPHAPQLVAVARAHGALAAASVDMTGKGGALLALEPASGQAILERLQKEKSAPVVATDDAIWDKLRVEIGVPRWGVDFHDENYPQEAALENLAVSFQKGCYLGQEAVFMLQMRGHVKKKIVRLSIEGDEPIASTTPITLPDGSAVGSITSTMNDLEKPSLWALGYVKWKHSGNGTELLVAGRKAVVS